jgi:hypothetical protein
LGKPVLKPPCVKAVPNSKLVRTAKRNLLEPSDRNKEDELNKSISRDSQASKMSRAPSMMTSMMLRAGSSRRNLLNTIGASFNFNHKKIGIKPAVPTQGALSPAKSPNKQT